MNWETTTLERCELIAELSDLPDDESLLYFSLLPSWFWSQLEDECNVFPLEFTNYTVLAAHQLITIANTLKIQDKLPFSLSWEQARLLLTDKSLQHKLLVHRFLMSNLELIDLHQYIEFLEMPHQSDEQLHYIIATVLRIHLYLYEYVDKIDLQSFDHNQLQKIVLLYHSYHLLQEQTFPSALKSHLYNQLLNVIDRSNKLEKYVWDEIKNLSNI